MIMIVDVFEQRKPGQCAVEHLTFTFLIATNNIILSFKKLIYSTLN